jgi:Ca-activated chloride channel family protein
MTNKEPGGLFANGNRIPLKGVQIEVKASGVAAKVCVAQRYHNTENVPVEAVYSFPLDESCAVSGFEVEIGGKRIVGKIEEREQAFEKYDDAMAKGHGAFLVDQDRPNIFTASVGNLLPNQEATVRLTYVTELEQSGDAIRLMVPTTISPRYIPKETMAKMDPSELDHITPPTVAGPVPYGLKLSVDFEAGGDVREVSCPSHPARVALSGRRVQVELMGDTIQLDQDFVLDIKLAKPHEASALVARDGDGVRAVMLNLYPDLSGFRRDPAEFVFIVDRSGSMGGPSIEQARTALLVALRSLESGDRFNVIGFGSSYELMFKESVAYSQSSLDDAGRKIAAMQADLGGTEMLKPLTHALEGLSASAESRHIILITDGQIGNESDCLELARKHAKRCRIFTFGVGNGVSEHLLRGLARASGGQAEFIHPNERIEPKVLRQIGRIASASISNVRIDWGNLKTDLVAPSELPQLFNGDRFTVYGRIIGGTGGEVTVLADSPTGAGALRFPVKVDLERTSSDSAIPVLMARKAIQELEEGRGVERGSAQQNRKQNATRTRILELALRYQLMSSATSFVAVEEREDGAQTAQAQLRRVPVALTKGWGEEKKVVVAGMGAPGAVALRRSRSFAAMPPPPSVASASCPAPVKSDTGFFAKAAGLIRGTSETEKSESRSNSTGEFTLEDIDLMPTSADSPDDLYALTLAQMADGGFEYSPKLLKQLKITDEKVSDEAKTLKLDTELGKRVVITRAVLRAFEQKFAARKSEWAAIAAKAERWLAKVTGI